MSLLAGIPEETITEDNPKYNPMFGNQSNKLEPYNY